MDIGKYKELILKILKNYQIVEVKYIRQMQIKLHLWPNCMLSLCIATVMRFGLLVSDIK